eukprot:tig00000204_g17722.t1
MAIEFNERTVMPFVHSAILSFLRANPPPGASQNAFANQNVELKPRDLVYVLRRAAAMADAGAANVREGAPGSFLHLSGVVQNVLLHIDTMLKPATRELAEFGRAGGFEECLRLVHRDHPLICMRFDQEEDDVVLDVRAAADLLAMQGGLIINALLHVNGHEFWEKIFTRDRARTSNAVLDVLQAVWRHRDPHFPVTAKIIGDLVNLCASLPTSPDETLAIFKGPRLAVLLDILHTAVTVRPTAFESVAGDGPRGARIACSRINRTYVAIYCAALVGKILTGQHPDALQHPGFVNRLRRLVPLISDDIYALFGVLVGALEAGEAGFGVLAKSIVALAECISAVTARVPELPAAKGLRNAAQAAERLLASAYPPATQAFKPSFVEPISGDPLEVRTTLNNINCKISAKVEERKRVREEAKRAEAERERARREAECAERAHAESTERDATDREAAGRHMQRLKWSRARQLLNAVLKRSPGDAEARLLRIQCVAGAGDLEGAAREAEAWECELAASSSDAGTDRDLLARVQRERQKVEASMRLRRGAGGSATEDVREEHEGGEQEKQAGGAPEAAERRQRAAGPQQPEHSQREGAHVPGPTTSASAAPGPAVAADAAAGPSRQPPCRHFARGSCAFGARCRFSHAGEAKTAAIDIGSSGRAAPPAPAPGVGVGSAWEEGECAICYESLGAAAAAGASSSTVLFSCGHQDCFCALCIDTWRAKAGASATCPTCRDPIAAAGPAGALPAVIHPAAGPSTALSSVPLAPAGPAVAPAVRAPSPPSLAAAAFAATAAAAASAAPSDPGPSSSNGSAGPAAARAVALTPAASALAPRPTRPYLPPGGPSIRPTRPYDPFNRGAGPSRPA